MSADRDKARPVPLRRTLVTCSVVSLLLLSGLAGCLDSPPTQTGPTGPQTTTLPPVNMSDLEGINGTISTEECSGGELSNVSIAPYGYGGVQVNGSWVLNGNAFNLEVTVRLMNGSERVDANTISREGPFQPGNLQNFSMGFDKQRPRNFSRYEVLLAC